MKIPKSEGNVRHFSVVVFQWEGKAEGREAAHLKNQAWANEWHPTLEHVISCCACILNYCLLKLVITNCYLCLRNFINNCWSSPFHSFQEWSKGRGLLVDLSRTWKERKVEWEGDLCHCNLETFGYQMETTSQGSCPENDIEIDVSNRFWELKFSDPKPKVSFREKFLLLTGSEGLSLLESFSNMAKYRPSEQVEFI